MIIWQIDIDMIDISEVIAEDVQQTRWTSAVLSTPSVCTKKNVVYGKRKHCRCLAATNVGRNFPYLGEKAARAALSLLFSLVTFAP